jgi:hypothetical protein
LAGISLNIRSCTAYICIRFRPTLQKEPGSLTQPFLCIGKFLTKQHCPHNRVHTCMHTHTRAHTDTNMYAHPPTHTRTNSHTNTHAHAHTHTHKYDSVKLQS